MNKMDVIIRCTEIAVHLIILRHIGVALLKYILQNLKYIEYIEAC